MKTYRQCPICQQKNANLLHQIYYPPSKDRILPTCYHIVACLNCGMVYDDFDANPEIFSRHYASDGKYEMEQSAGAGGNHFEDVCRWNMIIDKFKPYIGNHDISVLDIGCGKGGFLNALWNLGYHDLMGIEPSQGCADFMRKHYAFPVLCSDFMEASIDKKFDCIFCSQVMEHLYNCLPNILKMTYLLKNGGLLYLEMPDASNYLTYTKAPFYFFDHEHINHFQPTSLRSLLEMNGFEVMTLFQFTAQPLHDFFTPNMGVIAKKNGKQHNFQKNDYSPILAYIYDCIRREKAPHKKDIRGRGVIWGCGAYCQRLLAEGRFNNFDLFGIIDLDQRKQGQVVHGLTIYGQNILDEAPIDYILITSVLYENEIRHSLKIKGFQGKVFGIQELG